MTSISIHFPELLDIALKGIRRAAVFMGLGINAVTDPAFSNYNLSEHSILQLVPPTSDPQVLANFKAEFSQWIVGAGLREVIETFAVFLDSLHHVCLTLQTTAGKNQPASALKTARKFKRDGLKDKFQTLSAMGIESLGSLHLLSINQARHCLTHRRGIVGTDDCAGEPQLAVTWIGFELSVKTPDGQSLPLHPLPPEGLQLDQGGEVILSLVDRTRLFPVGSTLMLPPADVAEICAFATTQAKQFVGAAQRFAISFGFSPGHNPVAPPSNLGA